MVALAMVVQTGHSGGQLVYRDGAAQAYVRAAAPGAPAAELGRGEEREERGERDAGD